MQTLFNKILDKERVSKKWAHVALVMLHKKGDLNDPSNYRGLAMINQTTTMLTMILKHRLDLRVANLHILPEKQTCFMANKSCLDNIFSLYATVQLTLRKKKVKMFGVFVDFKKAFDSVPHLLLWRSFWT